MKTLYVDMDNVLVDFQSGIDLLTDDVRHAYGGHLDDVPNIFAGMRPMEGAVESFRMLSRLFDTYILSTAPWRNPSAWSDKVLWVQEHLGEIACKRLILTHHKNLNRGDFLIDDRSKHGVPLFQGKHVHFGSAEFPDWPTVVAYLQTQT